MDELEWIRDRSRFDAIGPEWERLADLEGTPFSRHAWFCAWLDAFGPLELCTCVQWRGGRMAAAFPLRRTNVGAASIANVHTPVMQPLGLDRESIVGLYEDAAGEFGQLLLQPLPHEFLQGHELVQAAGERGLLTVTEPLHTSPFVETSGDLEEWRNASKPRWGAPLERFRRKAGRERSAELALVFAPDELDRELDECFRLEASGWKGKEGTAMLSRPETEAFYRRIARAFHARDELRLSTLRLEGRLAAFDLCLLQRGRLYLLKTGYDEVFRKLAPGLVLQLSVVEHCFAADIEVFDLLGARTQWKLKFSTGERRHVALRSFRRSPRAVVHYAYRRGLRPRLRRASQLLRHR